MDQILYALLPIACGCILPIFAIWMGIRKEMNETNTRTQIALAAIEKNPDMDLEELMNTARQAANRKHYDLPGYRLPAVRPLRRLYGWNESKRS